MFSLLKFKEAARTTSESTDVPRTAIPEGTTLEQLGAELRQLYAQKNSDHHRMGEIYNHIVDKKLAEKVGYKDARDYFSQQFADLSQSVLSMYGAVAAQFTEPVARRFGFPQGKGTRVKVVVRNEKGKAVMDFKGIPEDQLELLAEALLAMPPSVPPAS